jgi:hypothetical protein
MAVAIGTNSVKVVSCPILSSWSAAVTFARRKQARQEEIRIKMGIKASDDAYKIHPYEELSKEFQEKWPTAVRAFELVPLMYNRLTLVDGYSHKAAINKIYNDHAHLPGFSRRNIRRNLPEDNPMVPRRIRPSWPKTSITENDSGEKFSDTGLDEQGYGSKKDSNIDSAVGSSSQDAGDEKDHKPREGHEQLPTIPEGNPRPTLGQLNVDFEFYLLLREVRPYMASRFKADGDIAKVWFHGTIDPRTGSVVRASCGRKEAGDAEAGP